MASETSYKGKVDLSRPDSLYGRANTGLSDGDQEDRGDGNPSAGADGHPAIDKYPSRTEAPSPRMIGILAQSSAEEEQTVGQSETLPETEMEMSQIDDMIQARVTKFYREINEAREALQYEIRGRMAEFTEIETAAITARCEHFKAEHPDASSEERAKNKQKVIEEYHARAAEFKDFLTRLTEKRLNQVRVPFWAGSV